MTFKSIVDKLDHRIILEGQDEATGYEHLGTIEEWLEIKIPQWYLDFLENYGRLSSYIPTGEDSVKMLVTYDLESVYDFINDFSEFLDELKGFLPIGDDMGSFRIFYTQLWNPPGIYVSGEFPSEDYCKYLASDIESLLTGPESITRYITRMLYT